MQGQEIGSYIMESPLGRGGMGEVWLARHKSLETRAAIKVLSSAVDEPEFHERFSREARAQARLSHPNIARVLDHVQKDGRWYLVTEYMARGTLRDALRQSPGPVPVDQALAWTRQALRGLEHAHHHGIVHRDVKPANILLNDRGEAAVTDFGLAKMVGGTQLTRTGTALGTPAYMSPEQLSGEREVDHRTDLYSLGVVLYELLTGRVPFPMETASEVVRILVNEPPPLEQINPDLPPELGAVVMRALAKNPDERYGDAAEFCRAIEEFEAGWSGAQVQRTAVAPMPPPPLPPPPPPPDSDGVPWAAAAPPGGPGTVPTEVVATAPASGYRHDEPVAILADEAQRAPSQTGSRGGTSPGLVAAGVAALALLMLALAAGAAYLAWPVVKDKLGIAGLPSDPSDPLPDSELPDSELPDSELPDSGLPPELPPGQSEDRMAAELDAQKHLQQDELEQDELEQDELEQDELEARKRELHHDFEARKRQLEAEVEASRETVKAEKKAGGAGDDLGDRGGGLRSRPLPPPDPTLAVIALGDPLFARAFEEEVESRLRGLGFYVADEHNSVVVSDALRRLGDDVSVPDLLPVLEEAGFHVLVLIQVQYTGSRELRYLGRASLAHQARLRLNAYLVSGDGSLGSGWSDDVEYTELSAGPKAETAMFEATTEMSDTIHYGWQEYRRDLGGG